MDIDTWHSEQDSPPTVLKSRKYVILGYPSHIADLNQAPPKKVKVTPKLTLYYQDLGNDAKHISENGFLMAK